MTREQREAELRSLMHTEPGRGVILSRYKQVIGTPPGSLVQPGTPFGSMIEAILDHEYPAADPT